MGIKGNIQSAQQFLRNAQNQDGGWPYTPGKHSTPEATCYNLLALFSDGTDVDTEVAQHGIDWLTAHRNADGVMTLGTDDAPHWSTSFFILTMTRLKQVPTNFEKTINWFLGWEGKRAKYQKAIPLDSKLRGWPWTNGAFSWVEPTSYALLALKAAGHASEPRVTEGEKLLLDRACAGGGWNYGNRTVLDRDLDAFLPTTAVALLALQNVDTQHPAITQGLAFLKQEIQRSQSTLTLALVILCLHAYDQPFADYVSPLVKRQRADGSWRQLTHLTALACLALQCVTGGANVFKL